MSSARFLKPCQFPEAEAAYDAIRSANDLGTISANRGMRESWGARIKDHVFNN